MQNDVDIEWRLDEGHIPYFDALDIMEERNHLVQGEHEKELIWLLEHPPLYTAGTSADPSELLSPKFPIFQTGRGGRHTYHGPGQRIGYLILNLKKRQADVRNFVHSLEHWIISALAKFEVEAWAVEGRVGIWCKNQDGEEAKIGAIGIRIKKWVTMHGFSVNIDPDLSHFDDIIPCGISEFPVTSLTQLGIKASMDDFDQALHSCLPDFLRMIAKK